MTYQPPRSRDELLARYAAGERHFVDTELDIPDRIVDLDGAVLDGADFSEGWFTATFRGASLRATKFRHANVKCCDFTGADLTDADFREAALEATKWSGATLLGIQFGDVSLYGTFLTEAEFLNGIERE